MEFHWSLRSQNPVGSSAIHLGCSGFARHFPIVASLRKRQIEDMTLKKSRFLLPPLFFVLISISFFVTPISAFDLLDFPQKVSDKLGISLFASEILISVIILCTVLFPVAVFAKGRGSFLLALILGFSTMSFLVALGWLPIWIFLVLALLTALLFGGKMRGLISGGD